MRFIRSRDIPTMPWCSRSNNESLFSLPYPFDNRTEMVPAIVGIDGRANFDRVGLDRWRWPHIGPLNAISLNLDRRVGGKDQVGDSTPRVRSSWRV